MQALVEEEPETIINQIMLGVSCVVEDCHSPLTVTLMTLLKPAPTPFEAWHM